MSTTPVEPKPKKSGLFKTIMENAAVLLLSIGLIALAIAYVASPREDTRITTLEGKMFSQGAPVAMFYTAECDWCHQEMIELMALYPEYKVRGVNLDWDADSWTRYNLTNPATGSPGTPHFTNLLTGASLHGYRAAFELEKWLEANGGKWQPAWDTNEPYPLTLACYKGDCSNVTEPLLSSGNASVPASYEEANETAMIGNPASQHCVESGGKLVIHTADDMSEYGICVLSDGTECDEWAYLRGECPAVADGSAPLSFTVENLTTEEEVTGVPLYENATVLVRDGAAE
jgi:putative hemolysin